MNDIKNVELPDEGKVVEPESDKIDYVEFLGTDPSLYGTQFHTEHGISRKHMKEHHDLTMPKDLTWKKGKNGRFLVPVGDMTPEVAEVLANDPMFKLVTL